METYTCKQGTRKFDKYKWQTCGDCPFLYTYKGDHYTEDVVRCDCDTSLKKGQKFKLRSQCDPQ
jgi:hypothetical protein